MSRVHRQILLIAAVLIILAGSIWTISLPKTSHTQSDRSPTTSEANKQTTQKNPCWYRLQGGIEKTGEAGLAYDKWIKLQTYGYPEDIPLSEAVRIFNEESLCGRTDPKRPPITEGEV